MNSIKLRHELAEETAKEYYEGNVQNLLADVKAAGSVEHFIEGDASESEIESWRKGDTRLWAINCQILVTEVTEKKAVL